MERRTTSWKLLAATILFLGYRAAFANGSPSDQRVEFRIDAPTMVAALIQFSHQSGLQLMFPTAGVQNLAARKVQGELTPRAALDVLLQDSGMKYEFVNARTVSVTYTPERSLARTQ